MGPVTKLYLPKDGATAHPPPAFRPYRRYESLKTIYSFQTTFVAFKSSIYLLFYYTRRTRSTKKIQQLINYTKINTQTLQIERFSRPT